MIKEHVELTCWVRRTEKGEAQVMRAQGYTVEDDTSGHSLIIIGETSVTR